jgi:hypothetical protein
MAFILSDLLLFSFGWLALGKVNFCEEALGRGSKVLREPKSRSSPLPALPVKPLDETIAQQFVDRKEDRFIS